MDSGGLSEAQFSIVGIYKGPDIWKGTLRLSPHGGKATNLGSLGATLGSLLIKGTDVRQATCLTDVGGVIDIRDTSLSEFPNLTQCTLIKCSAVPVCPVMVSSTPVEYPRCDGDKAREYMPNTVIEYYGQLVAEVLQVPTEKLLVLAEIKPHLKNLITSVLRGNTISDTLYFGE